MSLRIAGDKGTYLPIGAQPLGVLGLPAGMLLLPDSRASAEVAATLRAGRVPISYPEEATYYSLAADGAPVEMAVARLDCATPEGLYNKLVLTGDATIFSELATQAHGDLGVLAGIQGYLLGACDLPELGTAESQVVSTLLHSAHAARLIEQGRSLQAVTLLETAISVAEGISPVFAAGIHGDLAALYSSISGRSEEAIDQWRRTRECLGGSDFALLFAEATLSLALELHADSEGRPDRLREAIGLYMEAMRLVEANESPGVHGVANMNLGLAYLSIPMAEASDQLRYGIAVSCLRSAVDSFSFADMDDDLEAARMNLASALVYAPSAHQGDNVVEAVEIYEEVAERRSARGDFVGYARARANQGTALAHLGIFEQGIARLHEARAIFEQSGMMSETAGVREMLDHIARQRAGN